MGTRRRLFRGLLPESQRGIWFRLRQAEKQFEFTKEFKFCKGSKSCNYDDGDPRVWFEITFFDTDGDSTTYSTRDKLGKNWFYYDNTGEWDGEETFTVKVPAFTETIRVCPFVEDDDAFGAHDKMSSGFCYLTNYIGRLDYREITYESDYKNEYCELEWEWYLY